MNYMICLVSDFDGTLYDSNFDENIKFVKEFVQKGNIFIINTGRTFEGLKKTIKKYNIPYNYLICSDGSCIYNSKDEKIFETFLDNDLKKDILNNLLDDKNILNIAFDDNNDIISVDKGHISRVFARSISKEYDFKKMKELNNLFNVKAYLSPNWINILDKNVNKLTGIKFLEKNYNLGTIYTVGDSINDIEMILHYNGYLIEKNEICDNYNIPLVDSVASLIKKIDTY